jgi:hypothetical protein
VIDSKPKLPVVIAYINQGTKLSTVLHVSISLIHVNPIYQFTLLVESMYTMNKQSGLYTMNGTIRFLFNTLHFLLYISRGMTKNRTMNT